MGPMVIEAISKAYQAENLIGSYCTAPLRAYNAWFQNKIQATENESERTAWKICHIVSGIFAYLTLGLLALPGIAINLCLIDNEYSLWARLIGVPQATDKFCEEIRSALSLACMNIGAKGFSGSMSLSSGRHYTYNLNQKLSFDIQDALEDASLLLIQTDSPRIEEDDDDAEEVIPIHPDDRSLQSQSRLYRMEPHINHIQSVIRTLSQKTGWYPEQKWIKTVNDRAIVIIPLPDHIPIPNFN